VNAKKPKCFLLGLPLPKSLLKLLGLYQQPAADPPAPAVFCSMFQLHADQCCLESLSMALRIAADGQALSEKQAHCIEHLLRQIHRQIPVETRQMMEAAAKYSAKQAEDRQQKKLFTAATASPSIQ
jgi:hypothetical protein